MKLFIDDGVKGKSHRKNIQNPKLKLTGMAYCDNMLVVVYAEKFRPSRKVRLAIRERKAIRSYIGSEIIKHNKR